MQTGYYSSFVNRTAELKSRKAAVKNKKLDKALYGVNIVTTELNPQKIVNKVTIGTQTDDSPTTSSSSMATSTSTSTSTIGPSSISSTATTAPLTISSTVPSMVSLTPSNTVIQKPPTIFLAELAAQAKKLKASQVQLKDTAVTELKNANQDIIDMIKKGVQLKPSTERKYNQLAEPKKSNFEIFKEELQAKTDKKDAEKINVPSNEINVPALQTSSPVAPLVEIKTKPNPDINIDVAPPILQELPDINKNALSPFETIKPKSFQKILNTKFGKNTEGFTLQAINDQGLVIPDVFVMFTNIDNTWKLFVNNGKAVEPLDTNNRNGINIIKTIEKKITPSSPTSSIAPTVASTVDSTVENSIQSSVDNPNERIAWSEPVQLAADAFMETFYTHIKDNKLSYQAGTTITLYDNTGNPTKKRLSISKHKPNEKQYYRWKFMVNRKSLMQEGTPGIDLKKSLEKAKENILNYNPNPDSIKKQTNGLGLANDQIDGNINISSPKVVYATRRGDKLAVKRGQLYVMYPSFVRGDIRLYNRSGRLQVTKSNASKAFLQIVKDIIRRNTFDSEDMKNINPEESALVNNFIILTKPIMPSNIDTIGNVDKVRQLKKRYEVLVGELAGGNHGKLIRDEMVDILRSLVRMKAMSMSKVQSIINGLNDF